MGGKAQRKQVEQSVEGPAYMPASGVIGTSNYAEQMSMQPTQSLEVETGTLDAAANEVGASEKPKASPINEATIDGPGPPWAQEAGPRKNDFKKIIPNTPGTKKNRI